MLVAGAAISYSPLLYRQREHWSALHALLTGSAVQPGALAAETAGLLDAYAQRIDDGFGAVRDTFLKAGLDALVVLVSDSRRIFDATNTPQVHVLVADDIWGDPARAALGEPPRRVSLPCDAGVANLIAEELAYAGFDISESRGRFRPVGDAERGAGPALIEPVVRLGLALPIVPIHINAFVDPCISGHRMTPLGVALADALALTPARIGILASGGLSGDPEGYMAGWIDDVLDTWVLDRLRTGRSHHLARIFEVESLTLRGSTREVRLWAAAGAAMERVHARAHLIDYMPLHHAAAGTAFMTWEN